MMSGRAETLGVMRIYQDGGQLWKENWAMVFEGTKDVQATVQILKAFEKLVADERSKRGLPEAA